VLKGPRLYSKVIAWMMVTACLVTVVHLLHPVHRPSNSISHHEIRLWDVLSPNLGPGTIVRQEYSPARWLRKNSVVNYEDAHTAPRRHGKAALISLVRNEELDGILQSMRQLEFYFNRRYNYPWLFFSEVPFSKEFIAATSNATAARTEYHLIPFVHWSTPNTVSRPAFYDSLDYLGAIGVGKLPSPPTCISTLD
jgi:alpha 1,2-mannosyltransferase